MFITLHYLSLCSSISGGVYLLSLRIWRRLLEYRILRVPNPITRQNRQKKEAFLYLKLGTSPGSHGNGSFFGFGKWGHPRLCLRELCHVWLKIWFHFGQMFGKIKSKMVCFRGWFPSISQVKVWNHHPINVCQVISRPVTFKISKLVGLVTLSTLESRSLDFSIPKRPPCQQ